MTLSVIQPFVEFDLPLNHSGQHDNIASIDTVSLIQARDDVEAIQCWLREYQYTATTYRSYRKEVERFLLWIRITLHKTLAQLTRKSRKPKTFTQQVQNLVKSKLLLDWGPEQISGYGKRHQVFSISHERIYQYILADKQAGGKLYLHLRHGKKRYRKRYGGNKLRALLKTA